MEKVTFYTQIVQLIIAIVGSSIITRIITIRQRVRQEKAGADKAETEVKGGQIDNIEKLVEKAYTPIIEDLTKQVKALQEKVESLEQIKDMQNERIDELEAENRQLRSALRELAPDSVPSRRGLNAKSQPRNADVTFVKKEVSDETDR